MGEVQLLSDRLLGIAESDPDRLCVSDRPYGRFTYGQIAEQVERIAFGLASRGMGTGDIVILQLPNWVPFLVFHLALTRIGVVTALIPITFRESELRKAISVTSAKAVIVPAMFAGYDYQAMAKRVAESLDKPIEVILAHGDEEASSQSGLSFEALLKSPWESRSGATLGPPIGLDDLTAIAFTSGTTGALKAAMFDTRNLHATNLGLQARYGLDEDDRILGCSPIGHAVGWTHTLRMTVTIGGSIALLDRWDAEEALRTARSEGSTFMAGATPFLLDLVYHPALEQHDRLRSVRLFLCGGATIPRQLMKDAQAALPATFTSPLWGMTECGGVTTCPFDAPAEKVFATDGLPCEGMEIRVVDRDGRSLPPNQEGELQAQGAMMTLGYFEEPELTRESYLDDGFFRTGDLARIDEDGYVRITGRIKDLIVRGGINIAPAEIEEVLFTHPAITSVAVVGMPDSRLGERICAFVTIAGPEPPDLEDITNWMNKNGVAKQKWPERIEVVDALPMTASKKIQKFKLREMIAQTLEAGGSAVVMGDADSGPRYLVVARTLQREIADLGPNTLLPTEEQLAERFGVSRITIRSALDILERSGLVSRMRGRGTVVSPEKILRNFAPLFSFEKDMANQGIAFATRILSYEPEVIPPHEIGQRLKLADDGKAGHLQLLRLVSDQVICYDRRYYPLEIARALRPQDIQTRGASTILEDIVGQAIVGAGWECEIVPPSSQVSENLDLGAGALVLENRYTWFVAGDVPVEAGIISYRIDRCKFRYELQFHQPQS